MNILVTGCAGFIGSSLIDELIKNTKNKIIGIDNFDKMYAKSIKMENMESFIKSENFTFYEADITDIKALAEIFSSNKIDVVVHLAAKAGVRASFDSPTEYKNVNVNGTINILKKMSKNNVKKIIFSSSSSVYGDCPQEKFTEDCKDLKPLSPYAQTKKACEDYIKQYSNEFGFNAVILRFFTVFGKKQRPDLAIKKFATLIRENKPIPVYGDGSSLRDYTYIDDIVNGIIQAIIYNKTKFEIINLGSEAPIALSGMISTIEKIVSKKAIIEHLPMQKGDVYKTYADISKAKNLLGYSPKLSFEDALRQFL